jgi:hypothetical protein
VAIVARTQETLEQTTSDHRRPWLRFALYVPCITYNVERKAPCLHSFRSEDKEGVMASETDGVGHRRGGLPLPRLTHDIDQGNLRVLGAKTDAGR